MRNVLICLCLLASTSAHALNAGELLNKCKGYEPSGRVTDAAYCTGYIDGATDSQLTHAAAAAWIAGGKPNLPYCLPAATTLQQMRMVFMKYIQDHPENMHYPADAQLRIALWQAFPCAAP